MQVEADGEIWLHSDDSMEWTTYLTKLLYLLFLGFGSFFVLDYEVYGIGGFSQSFMMTLLLVWSGIISALLGVMHCGNQILEASFCIPGILAYPALGFLKKIVSLSTIFPKSSIFFNDISRFFDKS